MKILITEPHLQDIFLIFVFIFVKNTEAFYSLSFFHWTFSRKPQKAFNMKMRANEFFSVTFLYDALKMQNFWYLWESIFSDGR